MSIRDLVPSRARSVPVQHGPSYIRSFQDEMNHLFDDFFNDMRFPAWPGSRAIGGFRQPAVDMNETDKDYVIQAELPGISAKDLTVSVADGYLTLKGEKRQETRDNEAGYVHQERFYGTFQRVIALPDNADLDASDAQVKDGVLKISIPKKAGVKTEEKKINIREMA